MECRSVMAALRGNMLTVSVLLSVFCLSGAQTQCNKDAALLITTPNQLEALGGSCLQIPCNVSEKPGVKQLDKNKETFGVWIKSDSVFSRNPNNVIFNSSKTQNSYNIEIIGELKQRNCTTVFLYVISSQTDVYFFRIENILLNSTASCHPVHIKVRDSAWSPRIELSADATKKNSVTITCSALTPCPRSPPELSWNHPADSPRQMERNTDGSFTTQIQQSITLSDTHDGYNISCFARYPVKDISKNTPALVSAGSWFYLSCYSRAKYPISNYTWFNNSKHRVMKTTKGAMYIYNCDVHEEKASAWFVQQPQAVYPLNLTHLLPSTSTMHAQTSHPPMSLFYQSYEEMLNHMQPYCDLVYWTQPSPSVAMSSTQSQHHPPSTFELQAENRDVLSGPQSRSTAALPGSTGNISSFQLCNPSSTLSKGNVGAFARFSDRKTTVDVLQTKARRLMKNSKAAREYRQKKKDYIRSLESRVVELENQNKTLVEEIRTLMNIYQHKAE